MAKDDTEITDGGPAMTDDLVEDYVGIEVLVRDAMAADDAEAVLRIVDDLHYADIADLLERQSRDERAQFVHIIRDQFDPEVLAELDETVPARMDALFPSASDPSWL